MDQTKRILNLAHVVAITEEEEGDSDSDEVINDLLEQVKALNVNDLLMEAKDISDEVAQKNNQ